MTKIVMQYWCILWQRNILSIVFPVCSPQAEKFQTFGDNTIVCMHKIIFKVVKMPEYPVTISFFLQKWQKNHLFLKNRKKPLKIVRGKILWLLDMCMCYIPVKVNIVNGLVIIMVAAKPTVHKHIDEWIINLITFTNWDWFGFLVTQHLL